MARKINRLNARTVAIIAQHGRHADGGGLYLSISSNGGRRWVFLFRWHGKPTEIGFGSARDVTLARARELATQARAKIAESFSQAAPETVRVWMETGASDFNVKVTKDGVGPACIFAETVLRKADAIANAAR